MSNLLFLNFFQSYIQSNQRGAKEEVYAARHLQVDADTRPRVPRRLQGWPDHGKLEELGATQFVAAQTLQTC